MRRAIWRHVRGQTDTHTHSLTDDTTLIGNISNFKSINMQSSITDNINIELDKICDWLAVNKLSLNASKSNYMIFHHRQKKLKSTSIPILEMNHTLIKQVNESSFLGLTVNNHMDWNSHITNISNKITKTMGIMNRIKKSIPQQILNLMYNSLILPHTVKPRYNAVAGRHLLGPRYKRGTL